MVLKGIDLGFNENFFNIVSGMEEYFAKYSRGIYDVSMDFGPVPKMEGKVGDLITSEMNKKIPVNHLAERRKWRDDRLIALSQLKKKLDGEEAQ